MPPHDAEAPAEERWPEFMRQWLDAIGTPSLAMLPTPNSVPLIQRIEDIVARATNGVEQHVNRLHDAHMQAAAWQAEAARAVAEAAPAHTEPTPKRLGTHALDATSPAAPTEPPGRIDRMA